jgi:hypothetical protein
MLALSAVVAALRASPPVPQGLLARTLMLRGGLGLGSAPSQAAKVLSPQNLMQLTLNQPTVLRLGLGDLDSETFDNLLGERLTMLQSLDGCIGDAAVSICSAAAASGSAGGEWVGGKWKADPLARAAKEAEKLRELVMEELQRAPADHEAWGGGSPASRLSESSSAELAEHLSSASGVFGRLGAAAPLLRTMGWMHATLLAAGLDGGAPFNGWVQSHATRWEAMADQLDTTFGLCRDALDEGAVGLAMGGALSDVECAVALREAQTSSSLLHAVFGAELGAELGEELADGERDGEGSLTGRDDGSEAAAAEGSERQQALQGSERQQALQAAREAIEAVVPGYLEERTVFVPGHGFRDAEGQQQVRSSAAESYRNARRTLLGSGGAEQPAAGSGSNGSTS